jgi:hypothetical protein
MATDANPARTRRGYRTLAVMESAGSDSRASEATPSMAVSIAGVSTACSKDALVSSAEAVRRTLSDD